MIKDFDNIEELLSNPLFLELKAYGLIYEIALRNFMIKSEYRILRNNLSLVESVYQLSFNSKKIIRDVPPSGMQKVHIKFFIKKLCALIISPSESMNYICKQI